MAETLVLLAAYSFIQEWGGWIPIVLLATVVAIIINAALLMFARGFSIKELERFAESEMMQALATGLMATLLVGLVTGAETFVSNQGWLHGDYACGGTTYKLGVQEGAGGTEGTPIFDTALDAVRCSIQTKARTVSQIQEDNILGAWFYFNAMNTQLSIVGLTIFKGEWSTALYKKTENARLTNNLATVLLIGLNAVSFLVLYVKNNMLTLFLPLGILMRGFYFTRGVGAFLMSLAIGLYLIFPLFYIMFDPGFVKTPLPPPPVQMPQQSNLCYPTFSSVTTLISTTQAAASTPAAIAQESIVTELTKAYISLLLHPLLALFLTLAVVRYLMTVLGGDTADLMKMVTKVI